MESENTESVNESIVGTLCDWVKTGFLALVVYGIPNSIILDANLLDSRVVCAIVGASSLTLYWLGCKARRAKPESKFAHQTVLLGKIFMLIVSVNGYSVIFDNLIYNHYVEPGNALAMMVGLIIVIFSMYLLLSRIIKKISFS